MNFWDWFQITTVILFVLILIAKASMLRIRNGINPIVIGRGKRGFHLLFEIYAFLGLLIWIVEMVLRSSHTQFRIFPEGVHLQLIDSEAAKMVGAVLVAVGLIVFLWAFYSFGSSWRVGVDTQTPGTLITSGVFAISRNPIYLFLDLWFIGVFLINGTLVFLLFALLAIVHMHYQILQEEKFLRQFYGRPYEEYQAHTPRYLLIR